MQIEPFPFFDITQYVPWTLESWLPVFLWMLIGITFAILTRREEITMPSKVGSKIKTGTLGQYVITACLSFFFHAFGVPGIVAGLYAGTGGTVANQLQKMVTTKLSQAEMEEKLREMINDFEAYKEYSAAIEGDREKRVFTKIVSLLKKTPEEVGQLALKILGKEGLAPAVEISAEVIEQIIENLDEQKAPIVQPVVPKEEPIILPDAKMELSVQEAKELLRKAQKKSIFRR